MKSIWLLLVLASCTTTKLAEASSITGKYWQLVEINGIKLKDVQLAREPYIIFSALDNRLSANAGCNNIIGSYSFTAGNKLHISQVGATKMACPDMSIEKQFLEMLPQVTNFEVRSNMLTLTTSDPAKFAKFKLSEKP